MQHSKSRQAPLTLILSALAALLVLPAAHAQRESTAAKGAEISAFGGYTDINSDYGPRNRGVTIGADYTRFFPFPIAPSLELRANRTSGLAVTEEAILAGLRFEAPFHRFHPYGTVLFGGTKILFKYPPYPGYTSDQALATSIGAGVDVDVIKNFRAKFDYQQQFENFGDNFTLTPGGFTFGVVYRIPFKARQGTR